MAAPKLTKLDETSGLVKARNTLSSTDYSAKLYLAVDVYRVAALMAADHKLTD